MKAPRVMMPRWRHKDMKLLDLANLQLRSYHQSFARDAMEWEMIDINCAKKDVKSPMAAELTLAASVLVQS